MVCGKEGLSMGFREELIERQVIVEPFKRELQSFEKICDDSEEIHAAKLVLCHLLREKKSKVLTREKSLVVAYCGYVGKLLLCASDMSGSLTTLLPGRIKNKIFILKVVPARKKIVNWVSLELGIEEATADLIFHKLVGPIYY
jgi:hypothetical protein